MNRRDRSRVSVGVGRSALLVVALAIAGCGGQPTAATSPAPASATQAPSSPSAASAAIRVEGTVQSATAARITLADGSAIDLGPTTRIIRTDRAATADLKTGVFVAITAKQQPDGTLLASIVSIFAESVSRSVPPGQRPLAEGNLMTNAAIAAIDQVSATSFTVTFQGNSVKVVLAPGASILKQLDVKADDLRAGTKVSISVVNGTAQSIQVQNP